VAGGRDGLDVLDCLLPAPHVDLLGPVHADRPLVGGYIQDVNLRPLLVSNLAQIRDGIKSTVGTRCSKQYGDVEFTYDGGEDSLYDAMSNSCTNHQSTSSCVRFLVDSLVGSFDPEYSYSGCTRYL
jgi:hypothetical protein